MDIIGIDPGKNGGIAILNGVDCLTLKMPDTPKDLLDFLGNRKDAVCYIENVHAMPKDGSKAAFSFGYELGKLHTAISASGIPMKIVSPQKWMRYFSLKRDKNEMHASYKRRLKAKAQQLFPKIKVTLYNCDAILIAEYGKNVEHG